MVLFLKLAKNNKAVIVLGTLFCILSSLNAEQKVGLEYFENHIRPMIHNECLECHGPEKQKGGFSLQTKAFALAGGDLGPAIVPGHPEKSLLVEAIERKDEDLEMPPKKALSEAQVSLFKTWIKMGAPWPEDQSNRVTLPAAKRIDEVRKTHWSFQPIKGKELVHSEEITAEVKTLLAQKNFKLSGKAKPRELIKRVYLDLIGLLPSIDEVEEFASDPSDQAYEKIIEELLSRPEYGERWGRHWLDVARYGDTRGAKVPNQSIHYPYAYTYRDYVVKAFNQDMPFDQFIHEQLAADHLKDYKATGHEKLAALGFLRVGPNFLSVHDRISDKVDVVTRGFLGLTVSCARCHDHKTDPITIKDYYALYSVFNNIEIPEIKDSPIIGEVNDQKLRSQYYQDLEKIEQRYEKELKSITAKNEKLLLDDVGFYLEYYLKTKSQQKTKVSNKEITRLNKYAVKDWEKAIPKFKPDHPLFGLYMQMVKSKPEELKNKIKHLNQVTVQSNVHPLLVKSLKSYVKDKPFKNSYGVAHFYAQFLGDPKQWGEENSASFKEIKMWVDSLPLSIPEKYQFRYFTQGENSRLRKIDNEKIELAASSKGSPHRAMVLYDRQKIVGQQVFQRGDPGRRGDPVKRRFLEVLAPMTTEDPFPKETSGRLALAQAITHKSNPLTARVMVNRIWAWHFGKSLVSTPSDYGMMTPKPLQMKLLDRLAHTFMANGWSIKKMHRLIMNSDVYRQSSDLNEAAYAKDPNNDYLWRFNRQRLSLEQMRDSMLAVSGSLELGIGGKSFDINEYVPRRTIYANVNRNMIPDELINFDAGNLSSSLESRPTTSVPQQALYLMNDEFVIKQADKLSKHNSLKFLEGQQWIRGVYHLAYMREPTQMEMDRVSKFMKNLEIDLPDIREFQWSYGFGQFDVEKRYVSGFNKFIHFNGRSWRMGDVYPHPKYRYVDLSARGGHTGKSEYTAVRRWTAPLSGKLEIKGVLHHSHKGASGDGVYGIIYSNKKGLLGEWHSFLNKKETISKLNIEKGEIVDFITYCGKSTTCDSYNWDPELFLKTEDDTKVWRASEHFAGPSDKKILDKRAAVAHILLMSNEFHFID